MEEEGASGTENRAEELAPGTQDPVATILGWAIFVVFFVLFINILNLPRTPLGEREGMQLWHDSLGWIVGALCIARLYWFAKGPKPTPPQGMPEDSFAYSRAILFMLVLVFALEFLIGIFYAWGEGRNVNFFGAVFPQLVETSEPLRVSTGYPHSALAFYYLMLFTIWIVLGWWQNRRYNVGWRRLFPGEKV
jgi:cytochrome b561